MAAVRIFQLTVERLSERNCLNGLSQRTGGLISKDVGKATALKATTGVPQAWALVALWPKAYSREGTKIA